MEDARFGFDAYHILLVAVGASLLVSYWLPHLILRRPPAATALLMACGMAASLLFPEIVAGIDPTENPGLWEVAAELVVIVVLFATGLRIDNLGGPRLWRPTLRLLAVTMPLTIAAVALLGWALAGMTVGGRDPARRGAGADGPGAGRRPPDRPAARGQGAPGPLRADHRGRP